MSNPAPLRRADQVSFAGLDTSNLTIAINLLKGEAAGDADEVWTRTVANHEPSEVFASLLSLLLLQARTAGESLTVSGGGLVGAAGYLSLLAAVETNPEESLLLHQVSMALRQDPDTSRVCLSRVSVLVLTRVCLTVARDLARRDNQDLVDHVAALSAALDTFNARSTQ